MNEKVFGAFVFDVGGEHLGWSICSQQVGVGGFAGAGACLDSICSGAGGFGAVCPVVRRIMANPAPNASIGRLDRYHRLFYFHLGAVRRNSFVLSADGFCDYGGDAGIYGCLCPTIA